MSCSCLILSSHGVCQLHKHRQWVTDLVVYQGVECHQYLLDFNIVLHLLQDKRHLDGNYEFSSFIQSFCCEMVIKDVTQGDSVPL